MILNWKNLNQYHHLIQQSPAVATAIYLGFVFHGASCESFELLFLLLLILEYFLATADEYQLISNFFL